jgi:hypothetical protein
MAIPADPAAPDVLVLEDLDLGFAQRPELWPKALEDDGNPRAVILRTSRIASGQLWERLLTDRADRVTVVLSADSLRERRAPISRAVSWDRTVEETVHELQEGPSARDLGRCLRVIVHFGFSGAAVFSRVPPRFERAGGRRSLAGLSERVRFERFLYHPRDLEGSWVAKRPGLTFANGSILAAALARHELWPDNYPLYGTVGRALAAMRANHEEGGGPEEAFDPRCALEAIRSALHPPRDEESGRVEGDPAAPFFAAFPHHSLSDPELRDQRTDRSNLFRDLTGVGPEYVLAKATDVVIRGREKALSPIPRAEYGKYFTVDREEIERINSVRNLVLSYQAHTADRRPLSLGVFGPPGSGKSFAIKQLASDLLGAGTCFLEFNLSQFEGAQDLHTAFHQVRDATVRGRIPVVFWDEFDTGGLKWLKEFLAPMQDAEFRAGAIAHPFGKAIFIFAGGTSSSFEDFDKSDGDDEESKSFRALKGPDFVSRLRGFVNIKGLNPQASATQGDPAYLVRRAVILRVALQRFHPHLIDERTGVAAISAGVVRAFLRVGRYRHGARSLESIVSMSDVADAGFFAPANLPPADLQRLHASEDFMSELHQGQFELPAIEALAEACHECWKAERERQGWRIGEARNDWEKTDPQLAPYAELEEAGKERNRLTARLTQAKLHELGYRIVERRVAASPGEPPKFTDEERERLTGMEHDIWLRDRLLAGWSWSEETNEDLRLHPDIAPYEHVPKRNQLLDRAIVDGIPRALFAQGYTLEPI